MKRIAAAFVSAAFLFPALSSPALTACQPPSRDVGHYLRTQRGWFVVDIKDLVSDDQKLWQQHRGSACPGIAVANLDGSGPTSYAVALLHRSGNQTVEKVVVLTNRSDQLVQRTIMHAQTVAAPFVIWRAPPGNYRDWQGGPTIHVVTDSIIVEKIEANTRLYYLLGGNFHSILTTN